MLLSTDISLWVPYLTITNDDDDDQDDVNLDPDHKNNYVGIDVTIAISDF